jgi:hypothetical protein
MSGRALVAAIVLPFAALCAVLWWVTQTPGTPTAAPLPEVPSPRPVAAPTPSSRAPAPEQPPPPTDADGPTESEEVSAAIQAAKPLVTECFRDSAGHYPGNQKVVLRFTLVNRGPTGYIKDVIVVSSTIPDPWVQACFLDALEDARFPPTQGGQVTVTRPFSFTPDSDTGPAGGG